MPDFSKIKFLPLRTDVVYRDNLGYNLSISNLPWGNTPVHIKRYRISKAQNLDLIEDRTETSSRDHGVLTLASPFPPDTVDLIVLTSSQ